MKKILLSILVLSLLVGCSFDKNEEQKEQTPEVNQEVNQELSQKLTELAKNHFEFVRIISHSTLDFNEETYEVTSTQYATYADYENKVRSTYSKEIADKILDFNTAPYYNVDGKMYINPENASFAGIYTGYKDINITVKESIDNTIIFETKIIAYVDRDGNTSDVSYNLTAKKENNSWFLVDGVQDVLKD